MGCMLTVPNYSNYMGCMFTVPNYSNYMGYGSVLIPTGLGLVWSGQSRNVAMHLRLQTLAQTSSQTSWLGGFGEGHQSECVTLPANLLRALHYNHAHLLLAVSVSDLQITVTDFKFGPSGPRSPSVQCDVDTASQVSVHSPH
ncbi:hypothetical protein RRG08_063487 [Elysia crispata]|uniref:Uncharacterized protein n=1 Tax=Elysia crispata TaxID=231223 RepID=A0AAE1A4P5_9GAST|nr:hypothetical protein RRG08_063487 [Elysia crispata]